MTQQYFKTDWVDGTSTLVAMINQNPPTMCFNHGGETVATIDSDGNLNIRGELFENINTRELSVVHPSTKGLQLWPNPFIFYEGKPMTAFLIQDPEARPPYLTYPAFFWDDQNFYTWTAVKTKIEGPASQLVTVEPITMDDGRMCAQLGIRGEVRSEKNKANNDTNL